MTGKLSLPHNIQEEEKAWNAGRVQEEEKAWNAGRVQEKTPKDTL